MSARTLSRGVLAALLGAACALLVACGSDKHLIPASDAAQISKQLAALQFTVDHAKCGQLDGPLGRLSSAVDNLPTSVNAELRRRLRAGVTQLQRISLPACNAITSVTETTPAVTTDQSPITTVTPPPETTPTTPETTPTTPEPPTPTETVPDTRGPGDGSGNTGGATAG